LPSASWIDEVEVGLQAQRDRELRVASETGRVAVLNPLDLRGREAGPFGELAQRPLPTDAFVADLDAQMGGKPRNEPIDALR
jgi:hypothetical protein